MERPSNRWLIDDLYFLKNEVLKGKSIKEISLSLKRSSSACATCLFKKVRLMVYKEEREIIDSYLTKLPKEIFDMDRVIYYREQQKKYND